MLEVNINPMLDFREHILHITKDVNKLAKAQSKRKLSPPLKAIAIEQLLKSEYHATHLGVFNNKQLTTVDGILKQSIETSPRLPTQFPH